MRGQRKKSAGEEKAAEEVGDDVEVTEKMGGFLEGDNDFGNLTGLKQIGQVGKGTQDGDTMDEASGGSRGFADETDDPEVLCPTLPKET